jgi:hypothetical protein
VRLPEDLRLPGGGEALDHAAAEAVRLAHRVLERFPDVVRQHKLFAGGAAVSSALVVLAGVAVARRMQHGASAEEAVEGVTEDELVGLRVGDSTKAVEVTEDAPTNGSRPDGGAEAPGEDAPAGSTGSDETTAEGQFGRSP